MGMDTEPLPTNQARPLMYVPIIKNIYSCAHIFCCMKSALCYNLVLVIKDQGYVLTIDYIKKKQKLTLVSPHTARHHFI